MVFLCIDKMKTPLEKMPLTPWWSLISCVSMSPTKTPIFSKTLRWDEPFSSADICQDMVITCTFKLTRWALPILSSTLDTPLQELSKLSRCQTATYHVHITSARPSCSLWFILPGWGRQWPCEECFRHNNPPEEALTAVFSLVANKAVAVKPRLADTLQCSKESLAACGEGLFRG